MLGAWLLVVLLTGFVGLATISASLAAVVFIGLTRLPEQSGLFVFACCDRRALLIYAHRGNINRMLNGTESRFARPARRAALLGGKGPRGRLTHCCGRSPTASRTRARSLRARSASLAPPFGKALRSSRAGVSKCKPCPASAIGSCVLSISSTPMRCAPRSRRRTLSRVASLDVFTELDSTNRYLLSQPAPRAGALAVVHRRVPERGPRPPRPPLDARRSAAACACPSAWQFADTPAELAALDARGRGRRAARRRARSPRSTSRSNGRTISSSTSASSAASCSSSPPRRRAAATSSQA